MEILNEIEKMETILKDMVIEKFLKLDPESFPSELSNNGEIISVTLTLIENKSCVVIDMTTESVTFEVKEKTNGSSYYSQTYTFNEKLKKFGNKKHKEFKKKVKSFFEFKTNEEKYKKLKYVLENNINNQDIRKVKLEELMNNENR